MWIAHAVARSIQAAHTPHLIQRARQICSTTSTTHHLAPCPGAGAPYRHSQSKDIDFPFSLLRHIPPPKANNLKARSGFYDVFFFSSSPGPPSSVSIPLTVSRPETSDYTALVQRANQLSLCMPALRSPINVGIHGPAKPASLVWPTPTGTRRPHRSQTPHLFRHGHGAGAPIETASWGAC
jgi:hypothetical protein